MATKIKLALIVSKTYPEITEKMLEAASGYLEKHGATVKDIIKVPGCFDIPVAAEKAASDMDIDGVVTLGAIIKGETSHDEIIGNATAKSLQEISLRHKKPVTLGISGPNMTREQAAARIESMAVKAAEACMKLIEVLK